MLLASINAIDGLHLARLRLLFSKVVVSGEHTQSYKGFLVGL